ncbi:MAG TPA: SDR family oxidoreductase [Methylomirabilota bacterium]|nr:SDR family oxidoreductase [Methylomirabilota bacterium]
MPALPDTGLRMNQDSVLIIGASGLTGYALLRTMQPVQPNVVGTYANHPRRGLCHLDITDVSQVRDCLSALRPKTIYLTAALTHVDYCEDHLEDAVRQNVDGPRQIAQKAAALGAKLVFYSTEYVFDGRNGPYDEEAMPAPLSVYGKTKLLAEQAIREICADYLIVRTTVVYGWERESKNFAMQIYERVKAGAKMTIPDDQVGTPTLAEYLAETSLDLVQRGTSGVVNVVGKDLMARSEFARALVNTFGGNPELVIPVTTASLKQKAARPLRGGLRTEKLARILAKEPPSIAESLERLRSQWQADPGG